jgi:hypothetical protein
MSPPAKAVKTEPTEIPEVDKTTNGDGLDIPPALKRTSIPTPASTSSATPAPVSAMPSPVSISIAPETATAIPKPPAFDLNKFKSKRAAAAANVGTLQTALPHYSLAAAKDFCRLHPDEEQYWSDELCFVRVPIKGQKRDTLHLIDEDIAMRYLPAGKILRFRLALATKPYDVFFLCEVPTQNLDNSWNATNKQGCEMAKSSWVQMTSRKDEGVENYKIDHARDQDAFPDPKWTTQSLGELIEVTFAGMMIDADDHPGLLRLIGAKQIIT